MSTALLSDAVNCLRLAGWLRDAALGIDEEVFGAGDVDAINDANDWRSSSHYLSGTRWEHSRARGRQIELVAPLTDEDLARRVSDLPESPDLTDGRLMINAARASTTETYREHLD